jgi:murein DD-endopeptidase MepM/ murein hydrolase activator NlpD
LSAPVANPCVTSPYGPRRTIGPRAPAAFHWGIDLRAPAGGAVMAIAPGSVLAVRRTGAAGLSVTIRHGELTALYAHLGAISPALAEGKSRVAAGERIGVVGRTGVTYGTHLYFELQRGGQRVDPAPILGVRPCD